MRPVTGRLLAYAPPMYLSESHTEKGSGGSSTQRAVQWHVKFVSLLLFFKLLNSPPLLCPPLGLAHPSTPTAQGLLTQLVTTSGGPTHLPLLSNPHSTPPPPPPLLFRLPFERGVALVALFLALVYTSASPSPPPQSGALKCASQNACSGPIQTLSVFVCGA